VGGLIIGGTIIPDWQWFDEVEHAARAAFTVHTPVGALQLGRLRGFARRAGAPRMTAPVRRDIRGTWSALHLSDARVLASGVNPLRSAAVLDFADADIAAVHPHRRSSCCSGPVLSGTYATRCGRPGFRVPCRATSSARARSLCVSPGRAIACDAAPNSSSTGTTHGPTRALIGRPRGPRRVGAEGRGWRRWTARTRRPTQR
jgi:hypothetical protein